MQRRDLVATDTESGTLSYADAQTVYNRVSGHRHVAADDRARDQARADPVQGRQRAGRAVQRLGARVSRPVRRGHDGPDVKELEQNLVALGFDPTMTITVDDTFDSATAAAVERWQASVGETETGIVTLGQIVFLPGPQRITSVNTVLGSNGGSAAGSGSSGSSASLALGPARPEFVDLTTTATTTASCPHGHDDDHDTDDDVPDEHDVGVPNDDDLDDLDDDIERCQRPPGGRGTGSTPSTLAALLALLKAETLELKKGGSSGSTAGGTGGKSGAGTTGSAGGRAGGGGGGGGGGSGAAAAGGSSGSASSGSGGSGSGGSGAGGSGAGGSSAAQAILGTTSTQLVVTVDLDATKQSEAVVGEPVTVELPDGSTVDGKITEVSPVARAARAAAARRPPEAGAAARVKPAVRDDSGDDHAAGPPPEVGPRSGCGQRQLRAAEGTKCPVGPGHRAPGDGRRRVRRPAGGGATSTDPGDARACSRPATSRSRARGSTRDSR